MDGSHLKQHLPFINEMIDSVKTADFKQKWQTMKNMIESNKLSIKDIEIIELNIKKAKELREQYKKSIVNINNSEPKNVEKSPKTPTDIAKKIETKQEKELRRLHENIVKDEIPLPSKRRSALKRSYRDSLEFLLDKSPTRSEERSKPEVGKPTNVKKRKSVNEIDTKNTSLDDSLVSNKSIKTPEIKKIVHKSPKITETIKDKQKVPESAKHIPEKTFPPQNVEIIQKVTKAENSKVKQKEQTKVVEIKDKSLIKLKKQIQKHQKKDILKKKSRATLLTKGAAIKKGIKHEDDEWEDMEDDSEEDANVASEKKDDQKELDIEIVENIDKMKEEEKVENNVVEDGVKESSTFVKKEDAEMLDQKPAKVLKLDLKAAPVVIKKIPEKSNPPQNEEKILIKKLVLQTNAKQKSRLIIAKKPPTDQKPVEKDEKITESVPKQIPIIIKKVQNIAYIPCKKGFIFKCLVKDCKFQTMENPTFVDHIENEHLTVKWYGQCDICKESVEKTRSIIFELMHMRENHVLKEQLNINKLPDITEYSDDDEAVKELRVDENCKEKNRKEEIVDENCKEKNRKEEIIDENCKEKSQIEEINDENCKEKNRQKEVVNENPQKKLEPETKKPEFKAIENMKIVGKKIDIGKIKLKPFTGLSITPPKLITKPIVEVKKSESTSDYSRSSSSQSDSSSSSPKIPTNIKPSEPQPGTSKSSINLIKKDVFMSIKPNEKPAQNLIPEKPKIVKHIIQKPPTEKDTSKLVVVKSNVTPKPTEIQKTTSTTSTIEEKYELLRPWLKRRIRKFLMPTTKFLDIAPLVATYKCMSSKCSFFTCDEELFSKHLKFHESHLPGDRDYMNCAYCDFIFTENDGVNILIEHIDTEHCYDKYQCRYCFYRSCVSLNVINHQRIYHAMKPKSVFELNNEKTRNYEQELALIKKSRSKFVPPLMCVKCNAKFYLFPQLSAHMQTHGTNIKTKCIKCSQVTDITNIHTHFINCHKLGLYQCVFCNFGTNNFDAVINHLGSLHPSKPPIYCERSYGKADEPDPSSIESTSLKFLTQQVDHRIIQTPKINRDALRNEKSVGDLGGNFKINTVTKTKNSEQQVVKEISTKSSMPSELTIKRTLVKPADAVQKNKQSVKNEAAPTQKNSGLQIKSVYSLNNSI